LTEKPEGAVATLISRVFVLVFAFFLALTLLLIVLSFPLGVYAALFTSISPGYVPSSLVPFVLWLGPLGLPVFVPLWAVFITMSAVYLLLFVLAASRGPSPVSVMLEGLRKGLSNLLSNHLVMVVVAIGFLSITATAIDVVTTWFGVPVGAPGGPGLEVFAAVTAAPFFEEEGFRVGIVGLIAFLISIGKPKRALLQALWRPASAYESEEVGTRKTLAVWLAVAVSSLVFGYAHISPGSGWAIGKLPEAAYGGLVLGYVYTKFGFHASVLTHWGIDYLGTVFSFFGQGVYGIPWNSPGPGYFLQQVVNVDFVAGIGLLSLILVVYLGVKKLKGLHPGQPTLAPPNS
jgi:hypothetical protein